MPKTELGKIEQVDILEAWENEPRDFTPWLADNLDRLEQAIGVKLVDATTEVRPDQEGSDRFSADIVAATEAGEAVLIENQFTVSDHGHLGQIMTYMPGLKAKIIIWVAPSFRASHLSAIRWLNTHTEDDFSFFAVELSVVRIGDSALAPRFVTVERPNDWERQLQERQREISAPTTSETRRFWDKYVELFPDSRNDLGGGGRGSTRWREVANSALFVARWKAGDGVGLFVRGGRSQATLPFDALREETKRQLAVRLSGSLNEPNYPLIKRADFKILGEQDWPKAIEWLEAETKAYVAVLTELLPELD